MRKVQSRTGHPRRGASLLEVIAASTVLAIALVPALRVMRDSLRVSRQLQIRESLSTIAMSMLEHESQRTAALWKMGSGTRSGPGIEVGIPRILTVHSSSDDPLQGGIPGSLAAVSVTAFHDDNGNGKLDAAESSVTFATKVARFVSYSYEAKGS